MPTKIWGISDNRAGHLAQLEVVLQLLPFKSRLLILQNSALGKLNFSKLPLGVSKNNKNILKEELTKSVPEVILVIGRRNLSVALYLKKTIKKVNPNIKLVFLMPPGINKHKDIDFIFMHKYKMKKEVTSYKNIISLDFSPAKLKPSFNGENKQDLVAILQHNTNIPNIKATKPYIGVIIGGNAKGVCWNTEVASIFCDYVNNLVVANRGSLFVTTSRRTGDKISQFIKDKLVKVSFFWEFSKKINEYNPYLDIIINSDILIVTAETTSMIADCITLNPKAKILLFDDPTFKGKRFKPFINFLYSNNYAISLKNGNLNINEVLPQNKAENTAYFIANFIKKLLD